MSLDARLKKLEATTTREDWRARRLAEKKPLDVEALRRELEDVEREREAIRAAAVGGRD